MYAPISSGVTGSDNQPTNRTQNGISHQEPGI